MCSQSDNSPLRGGGKESRSRTHRVPATLLASGFCMRTMKRRSNPCVAETVLRCLFEPPGIASLRPQRRKRQKEAKRRQALDPIRPHLRVRRVSGGRARLSAFHRGSCCDERTPQLSSSYALPGTGRGAPSRWFERPCAFFAGVTRSFLSQSSGVSPQTGHHAGRA